VPNTVRAGNRGGKRRKKTVRGGVEGVKGSKNGKLKQMLEGTFVPRHQAKSKGPRVHKGGISKIKHMTQGEASGSGKTNRPSKIQGSCREGNSKGARLWKRLGQKVAKEIQEKDTGFVLDIVQNNN